MKKEIIEYIKSDKLKPAIQQLSKHLEEVFENSKGRLNHEMIALSSRLSSLQKRENLGVLSSEDYRIERNKITISLIEYIDDLPNKTWKSNYTKFNIDVVIQIRAILAEQTFEMALKIVGNRNEMFNHVFSDFINIDFKELLEHVSEYGFQAQEVILWENSNIINWDVNEGLYPTGLGEFWLEKQEGFWSVYRNHRGQRFDEITFEIKEDAIKEILNKKLLEAKRQLNEMFVKSRKFPTNKIRKL